jgi:hypothetical protein
MVKTYKDYLPLLKEEYPDIPEKVLAEVAERALKGIQHLVRQDHDVRIYNKMGGRVYSMTIVRPCSKEKMQKRALRNFFKLKKARADYK